MQRKPPNRHGALQNAVALAYNEASGAPRVVAKGRGILAETIIEKSQRGGRICARIA